MLKLGFYTGMRVGSITDLKVETLDEKNFVYLQDMSMGILQLAIKHTLPFKQNFLKLETLSFRQTLKMNCLSTPVKKIKKNI